MFNICGPRWWQIYGLNFKTISGNIIDVLNVKTVPSRWGWNMPCQYRVKRYWYDFILDGYQLLWGERYTFDMVNSYNMAQRYAGSVLLTCANLGLKLKLFVSP